MKQTYTKQDVDYAVKIYKNKINNPNFPNIKNFYDLKKYILKKYVGNPYRNDIEFANEIINKLKKEL